MSTPKSIIQKLRKLNADVELELAQKKQAALVDSTVEIKSDIADGLAKLAILAVIGGSQSAAWKEYMHRIVGSNDDNSPQFKRLTFQDSLAPEPYVKESNAYIVSNAVCGSQTNTNTLANVRTTGDETIDKDLNPE